jgi:hypothetical protein
VHRLSKLSIGHWVTSKGWESRVGDDAPLINHTEVAKGTAMVLGSSVDVCSIGQVLPRWLVSSTWKSSL